MSFDLYATAPVPPKPTETSTPAMALPRICGLRWSSAPREDGTYWAFQTKGWKAVSQESKGRLRPVGLYMREFARVTYNPAIADAATAEAVVKAIQAEMRESMREWRKAQKGKL